MNCPTMHNHLDMGQQQSYTSAKHRQITTVQTEDSKPSSFVGKDFTFLSYLSKFGGTSEKRQVRSPWHWAN